MKVYQIEQEAIKFIPRYLLDKIYTNDASDFCVLLLTRVEWLSLTDGEKKHLEPLNTGWR